MEGVCVTKEGVTKLLKGLNPSTVLRPDELHPRFQKELATVTGRSVFAHLSSTQMTQVKYQKSGHLQTYVPYSERSLASNDFQVS